MSSTLTAGQALHRSKPMERLAAIRFAYLLSRNPLFRSAMVEQAARARAPRNWVVVYEPASEAAHRRLLVRLQAVRVERGAEQWAEYVCYREPDHGPECYRVENQHSGACYEVHLHASVANSCDCPDFRARCEGSGVFCKHRTIVLLHREMGLIQEPQVYGRRCDEPARASYAERMAADFPTY